MLNGKVTARFVAALPSVVALFFIGSLIVLADTASTAVTVGNAAPTVSVSFNGGNNVTLTENTFVWATSTVTATDSNGCSEISSVTAQLSYASDASAATGATCSPDANTCYVPTGSCVATTTGNTCGGGGDTSVEYDCGFKIWYPARPSDNNASFWYVAATTTDGSAYAMATNTTQTIEVNTLNALDVTSSISFGSVSANSNTGSSNQTVTHTNTGNTAINNEISGDSMCTDYPTCAGDNINPSNQKFDTSDVTYASLANTLAATTSPATISLSLATSTATTSAVTDITYWGIAIPSGQTAGSYTGVNTFTAVSN